MFLNEQSLYVKPDYIIGSTSKQNLGSVYDDDACEYIYHHRVHTTHTHLQYNIFPTQVNILPFFISCFVYRVPPIHQIKLSLRSFSFYNHHHR